MRTHSDRVSFNVLKRTLAQDLELRRIIKQENIKPLNVGKVLKGRSIASLDWGLPTFRNASHLASQFGISLSCLDWLTAITLPPDQRPRHYVLTWIPKRRVGKRLIESPKAILKSVQQIILRDILNRIPVHESAHGFCNGRDVLTFVQGHSRKEFCLRMDLRDFFPSVSGSRTHGIFRRAGFQRNIATILARLCTTQTHRDEMVGGAAGRTGSCRVSRLYLPAHLPQGSPTSPALANLAAFQLDCRLQGLADSMGIKYSRYADDLLFSGDRALARYARQLSITVGSIALEEGFEANFRKTRFQHCSQRQTATGIVFNEKPNICRKEYDRLKALLFNCVKQGPISQNRKGHPHFQQHLKGRIDWVERLHPNRAAKLRAIFEQIHWEDSSE